MLNGWLKFIGAEILHLLQGVGYRFCYCLLSLGMRGLRRKVGKDGSGLSRICAGWATNLLLLEGFW